MKKYLFLSFLIAISCSIQGMESQQHIAQTNDAHVPSKLAVAAREYMERRQRLLHQVREKYKEEGPILLMGGFEKDTGFRQEGNFYYFTGLVDSGLVLFFDERNSLLLKPDDALVRTVWFDYGMSGATAEEFGIQKSERMGEALKFPTFPFADQKGLKNFIEILKKFCEEKKKIYAINSTSYCHYSEHVAALRHVFSFVSPMDDVVQDIYDDAISLRKKKSPSEIQKIVRAINLTEKAFRSIARKIKPGLTEAKIHAKLNSKFIKGGAVYQAYPCIAGTGENACVLHHTPSATATLKSGDLMLIDAGAELDYYCADISRTFPVSGTFSKRQKELYSIVLQAQEYVAQQVRPGMYLRKRENPEESLTGLAHKFLKEKGDYDKYMPHGVSHYLGLDVHDVGSFDLFPIEEGSVITIEPGIYIPEENIGIRIEDNYLITKAGAVCLSAEIPKTIEAIEQLMRSKKGKTVTFNCSDK